MVNNLRMAYDRWYDSYVNDVSKLHINTPVNDIYGDIRSIYGQDRLFAASVRRGNIGTSLTPSPTS